MRILITYPGAFLTGAARYAAVMAGELQRRGHQVTVALPPNGPAAAEFLANGLSASRLLSVDLPPLRRNTSAALRHAVGLVTGTWQISQCLRDSQADVVIGHCIYNMWTAAAAAMYKVPLLAVIHEMPFSFPRPLYQAWKHILVSTAAGFVAVSQEMAQALGNQLPCDVVPPGIDTRVFHKDLHEPQLQEKWLAELRGPLLVCVSHIMPDKGQLDLVEALPWVKERLPEVRAVFVGGTNGVAANQAFLEHLKQRALALGVHKHVAFVGPHAQVAQAYAAADVVVYPSRGESFGLVPVEAVAVGRPVVASAVGVAPRLAAQGAAIALFEPAQPKQLAKALVETVQSARQNRPPPLDASWTIAAAVDLLEARLDQICRAGRGIKRFSITK